MVLIFSISASIFNSIHKIIGQSFFLVIVIACKFLSFRLIFNHVVDLFTLDFADYTSCLGVVHEVFAALLADNHVPTRHPGHAHL